MSVGVSRTREKDLLSLKEKISSLLKFMMNFLVSGIKVNKSNSTISMKKRSRLHLILKSVQFYVLFLSQSRLISANFIKGCYLKVHHKGLIHRNLIQRRY